jgi:hypothetical protein
MKKSSSNPTHDPAYVQGQIDALFALITALAKEVPKEVFLNNALSSLESVRNVHLYSDKPDSQVRLKAIDNCEGWVKALTKS